MTDASVQSALPRRVRLRDTPRVVQARRIAVAAVLAVALVAGAWRLLEWRLGLEAGRLAAEGRSDVAPAVVVDWAPHVVAIALADDSAAARRARFVADQRINVAVATAREGDASRLVRTSTDVLQALGEAPDTLTEAGAAWARRLAKRVIEVAPQAEASDRLRLLADADDVLTLLGDRPTTPSARPQPSAESPPVVTTVESANPTARPSPQWSPVGSDPAPPARIVLDSAPAEPRTRQEEAPEPWRPDWRSIAPIPAPEAPAPPNVVDVAPPPAPRPPTDRELLAELLQLADVLRRTDGPVARGPTRAPATGDADGEALRRLESVRTELARRGFQGAAEWQLVELLSEDPARRVDLARRLTSERSGDSARLLLVLAEDADPRVRVAAIYALGSSSSRPLVEAAWRIASSDPHPSVGRLAEPLRERLR